MNAQKPTQILETALYVDCLDQAEIFYGSLIGLEQLQRVGNRHIFYRVGDGVLLIFNATETLKPIKNLLLPVPPHGGTPQGHMCFAADKQQIKGWIRRFQANNIHIEADFNWPNGARSIYVRDPAGNSIEFAEPWLWND
ncbi:MAG: VOC family protein [Pseudoruegeria sp.]